MSEGMWEWLMAQAERGPAPRDVFEEARNVDQGETRRQAKTRIMLEAYGQEGGQIRDRDLWVLRNQYVWWHEYVQGIGGGKRYDTHNPIHFANRYGMKPNSLAEVIQLGLRRDTVEEMTRRSMAESTALRALRILSGW